MSEITIDRITPERLLAIIQRAEDAEWNALRWRLAHPLRLGGHQGSGNVLRKTPAPVIALS